MVDRYVSDKIANMKMPEASVTNLDFKRMTFDSAEYLAKVSVSNPYPVSLPICDITYKLHSDGRLIASGDIPDPGSVKANETTDLDVTVKVANSVLLSLARDVASDWDVDYLLELKLVIDVPVIGKNITIPLSQKGEYKLPTIREMLGRKKDEKVEDEK